jgi:CopG family nickel-responsive transcriptional regulator
LKRRFGISLPEPVAVKLDELASNISSDRSSIVARALQEYLHNDLHEHGEHLCTGLIILMSEKSIDVNSLKSEIVKAQFTIRSSVGYITVLYVEGLYGSVRNLRKKVSRKCIFIRYIPLSCVYMGRS